MIRTGVALDDVYTQTSGRVLMSGIQALVRLPMVQIRRDRAAGLDTGGFVSGYRGSPLGGYDSALGRARKFLDAHDVRVQPAINEDLAATAIWGTQQVGIWPGASKDGVFGIWYGKGPGVDRSGDVLKHANAAGTAKHGGVLCLAGDDHGAKSSSIPHQSDHAFMSAVIPVLYPSSVHEFVRMGLLGLAMSRYSGCWVAMKVLSDTVESTAVVDLDQEQCSFIAPPNFAIPDGGLHIRWPDDRWSQDHRLQTYKAYAAIEFGSVNGVDRLIIDSKRPRFGIVASGKAFEDVREALDQLGIDRETGEAIGLRLFKVGMPWPLPPAGIRAFSAGLEEVLIIEERREIIENQIKQHLFNWRTDVRPRIVGKFDEHEAPFLPLDRELSEALVAQAIVARLLRMDIPADIKERLKARVEWFVAREERLKGYQPLVNRMPHYCPGCPHNTSTKVIEGSRATAGIGCHFMVQWMDRRTETFTHMGAEGVTWMGLAPYSQDKHIFVNLGDGTYYHSGILAIRQAVAAKINITYKLLWNEAVAMTGGQPVDGPLTLAQLVNQIRDEGVRHIAVLSDDLPNLPEGDFPAGVTVHPREHIDRAMEAFRDYEGCSVIVYDQGCAAELRRKRHRGLAPEPAERVFINAKVCEGCGDCSVQSNCIAIEPRETPMGRKREINQSACNVDLSCLKGFCPSFVTIKGVQPKKGEGLRLEDFSEGVVDPSPLPSPSRGEGDYGQPLQGNLERRSPHKPSPPEGEGLGEGSTGLSAAKLDAPFNIAVTGVGGTGVLTIGGILGMAAHLDGKAAMVLDVSGLAQKGGAVISHVRIGNDPTHVSTPRIAGGCTDLLLAADSVVAVSREGMDMISAERTAAIVNGHTAPVSAFVRDRDFDFRQDSVLQAIRDTTRPGARIVDFHRLATRVIGDAIAANMMMVGYAWQLGLLPLSEEALLKAIALNGVEVAMNKTAFRWGRMAAAHPERVAELLVPPQSERPLSDMSLDEIVSHRARHLTDYQDAALAEKYRTAVSRIRAVEDRLGKDLALTRAVAINYAKVLAYKDEYEVARLLTDPDFEKELAATFENADDRGSKLSFHLAPPLVAPVDPDLGRPRKQRFGAGIRLPLKWLARMKRFRGTGLDLFGRTEERKRERGLIATYEAMLAEIAGSLSAENRFAAIALAAAPDPVRGFGPVKMAAMDRFDAQWPQLLARYRGIRTETAAPARLEREPAAE
ncbi:MAG TPA: indolepyruvate ferredoxin oxidoreductase family protein [Dongiaceae bacterium]|nr:indolepyruvate ferredoxin oxidoreductase family protein [Dongiaceae bacterium]